MFSFFLTLFPDCPSVNHQLSMVEMFSMVEGGWTVSGVALAERAVFL